MTEMPNLAPDEAVRMANEMEENLRRQMMEPDEEGRVPCPECGSRFAPSGLPVHRAAKHGYQGQSSKKKVRSKAKADGKTTKSHASKVPDVTTDDIFDAVLGLVFTKGTIPIHAMQPLIRWREQTEAMLDAVRKPGDTA